VFTGILFCLQSSSHSALPAETSLGNKVKMEQQISDFYRCNPVTTGHIFTRSHSLTRCHILTRGHTFITDHPFTREHPSKKSYPHKTHSPQEVTSSQQITLHKMQPPLNPISQEIILFAKGHPFIRCNPITRGYRSQNQPSHKRSHPHNRPLHYKRLLPHKRHFIRSLPLTWQKW